MVNMKSWIVVFALIALFAFGCVSNQEYSLGEGQNVSLENQAVSQGDASNLSAGTQTAQGTHTSSGSGTQTGSGSGSSSTGSTSSGTSAGTLTQYTANICIENTKDNPQCKDCCDCLNLSADARRQCRDNCAVHNFASNSNFIQFTVPSVLGKNGDYSKCVAEGTAADCKQCCEVTGGFVCGDYRFCRDQCNLKFGNASTSTNPEAPPAPNTGEAPPDTGTNPPSQNQSSSGDQYNIEQAISDRAQMSTYSFSALAFVTGDSCSDSFLPPGKVADFSGFQYLRDNDPDQMGHNTEFVTMAADNVLTVLSDEQIQEFIAIDSSQNSMSDQYAYMRFPLMNAFRRQLSGDIPEGSSGLNRSAVMEYSAELYLVDAKISLERAKAFGRVYRSLTTEQRAYLDKMSSEGSLSWPKVSEPAILQTSGISSVNLRTYASEFFGWYKGSEDADTYFCPERQATYFGSFYMKDAPAMGNRNYSISTTITGDRGEAFLELLDDTQRSELTGLVDVQKSDLNDIVSTRRAMVQEMRKLMVQDSINDSMVLSLGERYGELDGEVSYYYATHFSEVSSTMTSEQKAQAVTLRDLADFPCSGAYLYSAKIAMPDVENTDFLFNSD